MKYEVHADTTQTTFEELRPGETFSLMGGTLETVWIKFPDNTMQPIDNIHMTMTCKSTTKVYKVFLKQS